MAIVVRLDSASNDEQWECVNKVAHITVGTANDTIKPKESNDLLERWLEEGTSGPSNICEIVFEKKLAVSGSVKCVLSR